MTHRRAPCGFSILELIMVLVAISFLAGMALPRYSAVAVRHKLKAAAHRIAADVHLARTTARSRSSPVTMSFKCGVGSYYEIPGVKNLDTSTDYRNEIERDYRTRLTFADFGGAPDLAFNGFGVATSGQVDLQAGSWQCSIVVDGSTGAVQIYGP